MQYTFLGIMRGCDMNLSSLSLSLSRYLYPDSQKALEREEERRSGGDVGMSRKG